MEALLDDKHRIYLKEYYELLPKITRIIGKEDTYDETKVHHYILAIQSVIIYLTNYLTTKVNRNNRTFSKPLDKLYDEAIHNTSLLTPYEKTIEDINRAFNYPINLHSVIKQNKSLIWDTAKNRHKIYQIDLTFLSNEDLIMDVKKLISVKLILLSKYKINVDPRMLDMSS